MNRIFLIGLTGFQSRIKYGVTFFRRNDEQKNLLKRNGVRRHWLVDARSQAMLTSGTIEDYIEDYSARTNGERRNYARAHQLATLAPTEASSNEGSSIASSEPTGGG